MPIERERERETKARERERERERKAAHVKPHQHYYPLSPSLTRILAFSNLPDEILFSRAFIVRGPSRNEQYRSESVNLQYTEVPSRNGEYPNS